MPFDDGEDHLLRDTWIDKGVSLFGEDTWISRGETMLEEDNWITRGESLLPEDSWVSRVCALLYFLGSEEVLRRWRREGCSCLANALSASRARSWYRITSGVGSMDCEN